MDKERADDVQGPLLKRWFNNASSSLSCKQFMGIRLVRCARWTVVPLSVEKETIHGVRTEATMCDSSTGFIQRQKALTDLWNASPGKGLQPSARSLSRNRFPGDELDRYQSLT
jgi:hypothetical protein